MGQRARFLPHVYGRSALRVVPLSPRSAPPCIQRVLLVGDKSSDPAHVCIPVARPQGLLVHEPFPDNHQRNAYGTTNWATDYAGRNPVEGVNGMIKNDGSLNRASCRVFGVAAHTLAALMAAVIHNLKHTRRARRRKNRNPITDSPPRSDTTPPAEPGPPPGLTPTRAPP